tara:strand:- start:423 stop:653 length:231 start_codon:yes stop_codon:yes gene_type:complete
MENDLEKSYREEIARLLTQADELIKKAETLAQKENLSLYYEFQAECDNLSFTLRNNNIIDYNGHDNDGWDSSEKCW